MLSQKILHFTLQLTESLESAANLLFGFSIALAIGKFQLRYPDAYRSFLEISKNEIDSLEGFQISCYQRALEFDLLSIPSVYNRMVSNIVLRESEISKITLNDSLCFQLVGEKTTIEFIGKEKIPGIRCAGDYPYYSDENLDLVEIPFENPDYLFGFILPKQYLNEVNLNYNLFNIPILSPKALEEYINNRDYASLTVYLPLMDIRVSSQLEDIFSKMDPKSRKILFTYQSRFFFEPTYQEVGEGEKDIYANHPFIYYVRHQPTNTLLMYGDYQA